jgi:hypothetical protein
MTSSWVFGFDSWLGCPTCYFVESSRFDLIFKLEQKQMQRSRTGVSAPHGLVARVGADECVRPYANLDIVDFGGMTHGID